MNDDDKIKIYQDGVNEGMKHITPSSTTLEKFGDISKEILELKTEWTTFKSRALSILLFGVLAAVSYGIWIGTLQTTVNNNTTNIVSNKEAISSFDKRIQANDITSAEIRTKLSNIETTLSEIKLSLKNVR